MPHPHAYKRWMIPASVGALAVLAVLPTRWMRWANVLGDRAQMLTAPVSGPVIGVMGWLSPATPAKPEVVAALEKEVAQWKLQSETLRRDNEELRRKFDQFGKGVLPSEQRVQQAVRRVIGSSPEPGEQLLVRIRTQDGVEQNTVATNDGVQLVGRVMRATGLTCSVRLITGMSAGPIECRVMISEGQEGPPCRLSPIAGGRLQGRVRTETSQKPPEIGQTVRLDDKTWPKSAQMLVVGTVSDRKPLEAAGFFLVTVEPTVNIERLSEVWLRIPLPEVEEKGPAPSTDGGKP